MVRAILRCVRRFKTGPRQTFTRPIERLGGLRHGELMDALAALPLEQRSVLLLVTVKDMPYAEVAKVLGVPIGTVMSRLSRARERLRRDLSAEGASRPQSMAAMSAGLGEPLRTESAV